MSADAHIRLIEVTKSYGNQQVLQGVTFDVLRGQTNMVIGRSGSGKSVLMRQIIRLEEPDSGSIIVDGMDIAHLSEGKLMTVRPKFGMVFQMSALFDSLTVFDNVAFPLQEHTKLNKKQIHERVMEKLSALGIADAWDKLPSQISGGMAKRAAVARALVIEPQILIYDEPTSGLDPIGARTVDDMIAEMQARFSVTALVISHDIESVTRIADRVNLLHNGQIILSSTPQELLASDHPVVREYLKAAGQLLPV